MQSEMREEYGEHRVRNDLKEGDRTLFEGVSPSLD
jgi:hypothetical protein